MDASNSFVGAAAVGSNGAILQQQSGSAFRVLTTFCVLITCLPIVMYFFAKSLVFEGLFLVPSRQSYIYSAILAVATVHIILAAFLLFACYEGGKTVYDSYSYKSD